LLAQRRLLCTELRIHPIANGVLGSAALESRPEGGVLVLKPRVVALAGAFSL
jgi:hypothetical protein